MHQLAEDEHEIVRRARAGERAAFDRLAARYRGGLTALAFLRTGNREDAEDVVQEALASAWRALPRLQEAGAFAPWLRVIVENTCRSWKRRSRWPDSLEELNEMLPAPEPTPLEALLAREYQRRWRRALYALPESNRLPLVLHVLGGCSYQRIADLLGMPLSTVEGRIHRARAQLRRRLRDDAETVLNAPPRITGKEESDV